MGGVGVIKMDNIMDTLERQSELIESQRRLFINTVEQFKHDLIYLQGCLALATTELKNKCELSEESLRFILNHVGDMNSMLNDFEARMVSYE